MVVERGCFAGEEVDVSDSVLFLLGLGLTVAMSLAVVVYLRPHLQTILVDLCATAERAGFWTAFSSVILVLVPALFALHYRPGEHESLAAIFALSA